MPDIYQKRGDEIVLISKDHTAEVEQLRTDVDGKAPKSHAVNATTYGAATGSNYGHTRLSDAVDSTSSTSGGYAATPKAVKSAYDAAVAAQGAAEAAAATANAAVTQAQLSSAKTELQEYTDTAVASLVDSAPETLNTLGELATALQENDEVTEAVNAAIGTKANDADVVKLSGNQTIAGTKTFSSVISGSVSGNAGTATKLAAAKTIALSGGATGTATGFDGSGNITIPVTALDVSKASAGTLAVNRGGTGVTANPSMLVNLASTTAASVFAASPRPGVTGVLPIGHGGTGSSSGLAPKATADASGNVITSTYATKTELSNAVTYTELALTTPIAAGATVTVPSYTVGKANINVFIDGVRCTRGDTFSEVGTAGSASTSLKFIDAVSADYDVVVIAG